MPSRQAGRLLEKIEMLSHDVAGLKQTHKLLEVRLNAVEALTDNIPILQHHLRDMKSELESQANELISTDLIINGIPENTEKACFDVFKSVCTAVGLQTPPVREIFRLPSKQTNDSSARNENHSAPQNNNNHSSKSAIIVKLFSAQVRNELFKAVAKYCKASKKPLSLQDLGIDGNAQIHIHECLSKSNRELMHHASQLKRQSLLSSAYSFRGRVFVRKDKGDKALPIRNRAEIDSIVAAG